MKKLFTSLLIITQSVAAFAQVTSTFESLPLDETGYWNGDDGTGGFENGNAYFKNNNDGWWGSGFGYSNNTDVTTAGSDNQYSVYTGSGVGHSEKFAIGKNYSIIKLLNSAKTVPVTGFYVANTTYAALDMQQGSQFSKIFGGKEGDDPDYFQLAITGYRNDAVISDTVKVKLADFTFTDNSKDYILDTWRWVDLRSLGVVDSLLFILTSTDTEQWGMNTPDYFAMDHFNEPLYDVAVNDGSTAALSKDDVLFQSWATACTVTRGFQDIAVAGALANAGTDDKATLKADGSGIVSLGDNGVAVLEFQYPVMNGDGPDFAVFENGFNNFSGPGQFLELAFVEVSSDGINYVRFPAVSKVNAVTQTGSFGYTDAALIHNLAGKYVANYGTPFDLDELKNNSLIDVNNITHVKIIDVIGSVNLSIATKDSLGNPVNDPYPTAFGSGGFDLDAVGVINQNTLATSVRNASAQIINVYPNPSSNMFHISLLNQSYVGAELNIFDANGVLMLNQTVAEGDKIDASSWNNGIYYVRVGNTTQKIIKID